MSVQCMCSLYSFTFLALAFFYSISRCYKAFHNQGDVGAPERHSFVCAGFLIISSNLHIFLHKSQGPIPLSV